MFIRSIILGWIAGDPTLPAQWSMTDTKEFLYLQIELQDNAQQSYIEENSVAKDAALFHCILNVSVFFQGFLRHAFIFKLIIASWAVLGNQSSTWGTHSFWKRNWSPKSLGHTVSCFKGVGIVI